MYDLKVSVHTIKGHCDLPMEKGDYFLLKGGRVSIPDGKHFCLYALQSVLPLLPAKQRNVVEHDDWLPKTKFICCPDPAGQVILKIERIAEDGEQAPPSGAA